MRTINNSSYNFTFNKDQYLLTSKLNTDLTYNLYYIEEGKVDKLIESKIILGGAEISDKTIVLPVIKDGRWRLELVEISVPNNLIYFTHSIGKRNLIIRGLRKAICTDCQCKDSCTGCNDKEARQCIANQSLFTLVSHYLYINKDFSLIGYPEVNATTYNLYKKVFNDNYDYLNHEVSKQCLDNNLSGSSSNIQSVFSYYMAIYYICWYLEAKEEIDNLDIESLEYLDKVYDYKKLSDCVRKLGINIDDIIPDYNVLPTNVYYWQLGISQTITDLQNIFNSIYLNLQPFESLNTFIQGYDVSMYSIGKLVFAITNIDNQEFIIYDALGNDVTENFETFYDISLRTIVFVSKPTYTISSLFFKFKQL